MNALSQDYTVPAGTTSLTLTFDMFFNDWAGSAGHESLDVLILGAGANPVTRSGTTLISTDTLVTGERPNPYIAHDFAITGFVPGDTYILDYLEADTMFTMNVGLDNGSLEAAVVAEPSSVAFCSQLSRPWRYWPAPARALRHQGKLLSSWPRSRF